MQWLKHQWSMPTSFGELRRQTHNVLSITKTPWLAACAVLIPTSKGAETGSTETGQSHHLIHLSIQYKQ
jgi:hypothetical protein